MVGSASHVVAPAWPRACPSLEVRWGLWWRQLRTRCGVSAAPEPTFAQVSLADIHRLGGLGSVARAGFLTQTLPRPPGFVQFQSGPKPWLNIRGLCSSE